MIKNVIAIVVSVSVSSGTVFADENSFNSSLSFNQVDSRVSLEEDGGAGWYILPSLGVNMPSQYGGNMPGGWFVGSLKDDLSMNIGIGKAISDSFALQLDIGYMSNSVSSLTFAGVAATQAAVEFDQTPILLSGIWGNDSKAGLNPYFGIGAGAVRVDITGNFTVGGVPISIVPDAEWAFAFKVFAGFSYRLSATSDLNIGYQYLSVDYSDGDIDNNMVNFGISFSF